MKKFIKLLQHSQLKIFIAPLAFILFGLILGIKSNQGMQWISFIQMYLLVFITEFVSHYFYIKYDQKNQKQTPVVILYGCQILMIALFIWLLMTQHWIVSTLVLLYMLSKHLVYYPYKFSLTAYHFALNGFFQAIVLNALAYFTQAYGIESKFYQLLIPIILYQMLILIQEFDLKSLSIRKKSLPQWLNTKIVTIILFTFSNLLGLYFSLSSQTFFLIEILYLGITIFISLAIIVQPKKSYQIQNKLNYLGMAYFIYTFMYALAYVL